MAAPPPNPFGEPGHPRNIDNERLFARWFAEADADGDGKLTGPDAVTFFARSGLPRGVLAKVWALADAARRGYLDEKGFAKAMELIALAQRDGDVSGDSYIAAAEAAELTTPVLSPAPGAPTAASPGGPGRASEASGGGSPAGGGPAYAAAPPPRPSPSAGMPSPPPAFSLSTAAAKARRKKSMSMKEVTSIVDGLKAIYESRVKPLEDAYRFGSFFSAPLTSADFDAKPSVLLLGQYSTGKTTFIRHLLGRAYPGAHVGPEPTTDRFVVVAGGPDERRTPGNTLIVQPDQPYTGLSVYGNAFLAKFECAQCPSPLLEEITLIDTPGVLSGEKQRVERTYDFVDVCGWFASRCDLILLLFDPHKLDVSDEFKAVISSLRGHDDKVRVVLNKADTVGMQQLMRVYGALMWALGKVFRAPEVCRVYIGSFNGGAPVRSDANPEGAALFEAEAADLLADLYAIPARACDRKVNEFVKRVRAAKIHALIVGHLRRQLPPVVGRAKAAAKLLADLPAQFAHVAREHRLPPSDFPDVNRYRDILASFDLAAFPKLREKDVKTLDDVLSIEIPALMKQFDNPYGHGGGGGR